MERLTLEEAMSLLIDVILGDLVHPDYHRVCHLARLYKQLITGEDIDEHFTRYAPREDPLLFEYKKSITRVITPAVCSSLMNPFSKVPRTNRLVKKVTSVKDEENSDDTAATKVLDAMETYFGSESNVNGLDAYMLSRWFELNFSDPNCWVVDEFKTDADGNIRPYPFEVSSEKARYFWHDNNILQGLITRENITYMHPLDLSPAEKKAFRVQNKVAAPTHEERGGYKWSMYISDNTVVFEQVGSDDTTVITDQEDENYDPNTKKISLSDGSTYIVSVFYHMTGKVPAKRVGYSRDVYTDGRTFVNPFHTAVNYLIDSIKTVAEFAISKQDHVFPQKVQYVPACPGESDQNSCFGGRAALGGVCKVCHGTGKMPIHSSGQDVITLTIPEDTSKMMDLNKVLAYFSPPIELVKFQNELVKQVTFDCHQAVFNSTVLLKDVTGQAVVRETATSKNFDMDSINDTLSEFASGFSAFWLFRADVIVRLTDTLGKVMLMHRFPSDFKMRTIGDLYSEMKTANDSNAPTFLIEMLNDDVAATKFQDDPDLLLQYEVKKRLNPFRGKSDVDIQNALNTDYTPFWKKVLSVNFDDIISQAELRDEDFYIQDYPTQMELVRAITEELIKDIEATRVTPTVKPIGSDPQGAIYSVGETVTVDPASLKDESHSEVKFKVVSVTASGDTWNYSLASADGIKANYSEDDLA